MPEEKREAIIQNLKDAGCTNTFISDFLYCYDKNDHEKQIEILENWRNNLLKQIHEKEKKISCLDYLIYKLQKG